LTEVLKIFSALQQHPLRTIRKREDGREASNFLALALQEGTLLDKVVEQVPSVQEVFSGRAEQG
jgi:hypothetical protein